MVEVTRTLPTISELNFQREEEQQRIRALNIKARSEKIKANEKFRGKIASGIGNVARGLAPTSPPRFKTARGVNNAVLVLKAPPNKVLVAPGFIR